MTKDGTLLTFLLIFIFTWDTLSSQIFSFLRNWTSSEALPCVVMAVFKAWLWTALHSGPTHVRPRKPFLCSWPHRGRGLYLSCTGPPQGSSRTEILFFNYNRHSFIERWVISVSIVLYPQTQPKTHLKNTWEHPPKKPNCFLYYPGIDFFVSLFPQ